MARSSIEVGPTSHAGAAKLPDRCKMGSYFSAKSPRSGKSEAVERALGMNTEHHPGTLDRQTPLCSPATHLARG